ncbi:MAG: NusA-like transcription termination signal-binding factor [Nitrososphaerota archaeon]
MSEGIKLTDKEMRYIQLFEAATGASVVDCVEEGDMVVFIVRKGELGKALTGKGARVKEVARMMRKRVKVVEFAEESAQFLKNLLYPAEILDPVRVTERPDGRKIAVVTVSPRDKGIAIGRDGKNISLARHIIKRHFDVDHVIIQ